MALAAFGSTLLVSRVNLRLEARQMPAFYQNAVGGFIATAVALALVAADVGVRPSLVVAGGIVLLLPGAVLVGAVQDAITGYLVTASARAFEAVLLTAGIVAGVAIALDVGLRLGVDTSVSATSVASLGQVPLQVVAAGVAAAASAASDHAPRRTLPTAALAGALGWAALVLLGRLGLSPAFSSAVAAAVVGFGSYTFAHRQQAPPLVYLAAGIIPLLPGLTIYRGMLRLADGDALGGLVLLGNAVTTGLALAAGAILGEFLAQPARREVQRFERRVSGPRLAGPLRWRRPRDEGTGAAGRRPTAEPVPDSTHDAARPRPAHLRPGHARGHQPGAAARRARRRRGPRAAGRPRARGRGLVRRRPAPARSGRRQRGRAALGRRGEPGRARACARTTATATASTRSSSTRRGTASWTPPSPPGWPARPGPTTARGPTSPAPPASTRGARSRPATAARCP